MEKEKGQGTVLEIQEEIMRRESTLCILQSVHAVWQVLHTCQHHSSELISLSICKVWKASSSQGISDFFVCSFWVDSEQKTFFRRNFLETAMLFFSQLCFTKYYMAAWYTNYWYTQFGLKVESKCWWLLMSLWGNIAQINLSKHELSRLSTECS